MEKEAMKNLDSILKWKFYKWPKASKELIHWFYNDVFESWRILRRNVLTDWSGWIWIQ